MALTDEENRELKNSIFATKSALEGGIPMQSSMQSVKKDLGFELPVASVPIPSRGLVYASGPLHMAEMIEIKAMTAKEEDILMNRTLVRKGTVITELLKSCVLDKGIDVNEMISGDRNALMVAVRITGYGSDYSPKVTCPSCDTQQDFSLDLQSLPIKELDLEKLNQVAPGENAFSIDVPISKKRVVFKFLTGKEEERMLQDIEAKRKRGIVQDNLVTTKLMYSIVSVDGNAERSYINQFCQYIPARDSLTIRKVLSENEPGIDMTSEFTCNGCGHQEVLSVPLGTEFFWPKG